MNLKRYSTMVSTEDFDSEDIGSIPITADPKSSETA